MTVWVSQEMRSDVGIGLVSRAEDGTEGTSSTVSLRGAGLEPCRRARFAIPLAEFAADGFDPQCTRMVKIVGYNSFRLELQEIYLS